MTVFAKPVDKRSRESMTNYLENHFRYHTMNGWNNSTSYAHNLKVYQLGLESSVADKLFKLIQTTEFYDPIQDLIYDFGDKHDFRWQAGFNGRSGGYLVLYNGERRPSGYKSYCQRCGQMNYTSIAETSNICGRCHKPARADFSSIHMEITSFPGAGVDHNEDYGEWDIDSLRRRTELVQTFDALADSIVSESVYMAKNYCVRKKTVYVPETLLVMSEV